MANHDRLYLLAWHMVSIEAALYFPTELFVLSVRSSNLTGLTDSRFLLKPMPYGPLGFLY